MALNRRRAGALIGGAALVALVVGVGVWRHRSAPDASAPADPALPASASAHARTALLKPAAGVVSGRIDLAPALQGKLPPGALLFVYAYAVDGPRVPLAMQQHPVAALPLAFTLDDSAAVNPALRLSMAVQVVVGARIGTQGERALAGDLYGMSAPAPLGAQDLRVEIREVVAPR